MSVADETRSKCTRRPKMHETRFQPTIIRLLHELLNVMEYYYQPLQSIYHQQQEPDYLFHFERQQLWFQHQQMISMPTYPAINELPQEKYTYPKHEYIQFATKTHTSECENVDSSNAVKEGNKGNNIAAHHKDEKIEAVNQKVHQRPDLQHFALISSEYKRKAQQEMTQYLN